MRVRFYFRRLCNLGRSSRFKPRPPTFLPRVELLECRAVPATLTIPLNGHAIYVDGSSTTLTITEGSTITFNDSSKTITVSGAGSGGFTGNGTHTVSGPVSQITSLKIDNPGHQTTLVIDDSGDVNPRTLTFTSVTPSGDTQFGQLTGLQSGPILFEYADTSSVSLTTGSDVDTVNVLKTGITTTISTSNGKDAVTIGSGTRGVKDIKGIVNIENPNNFSVITVDDAADTTGRTVTLDTFTPSGDSDFGKISGLAPADINYEYADTFSVAIKNGSGLDTTNVLRSQKAVSIDGGGNHDVVNVGNAGSVQDIQGPLTIENPPSFTTINVDDSADTVARKVTVDVFTVNGDSSFGRITGLAPAAIDFENFDTSSVSITTGTGADIVKVLRTETTINLDSAGGHDVVNVGNNALGVQSILGTLNIENAPSFTKIKLVDSSGNAFTIDDVSSPEGDASAWKVIDGLAPAAIQFEVADTSAVLLNGSQIFP
jgi:hypothetical protein